MRRQTRHTHLPSTKPLLYGGGWPIQIFAQQPRSVVGDLPLWRIVYNTIANHNFQSTTAFFPIVAHKAMR